MIPYLETMPSTSDLFPDMQKYNTSIKLLRNGCYRSAGFGRDSREDLFQLCRGLSGGCCFFCHGRMGLGGDKSCARQVWHIFGQDRGQTARLVVDNDLRGLEMSSSEMSSLISEDVFHHYHFVWDRKDGFVKRRVLRPVPLISFVRAWDYGPIYDHLHSLIDALRSYYTSSVPNRISNHSSV